MNFNPEKTLAVIHAYPDLMVTPHILFFLLDLGLNKNQIIFHRAGKGHLSIGYNQGAELALERLEFETYIFIDNDVRPIIKSMKDWVDSDLEVCCAAYPGQCGKEQWTRPTAFHSGLFRMPRNVLMKLSPPIWKWKTNESESELEGCICKPFADRIRELGHTIGWAGRMHHIPKNDSIAMKIRFDGDSFYTVNEALSIYG